MSRSRNTLKYEYGGRSRFCGRWPSKGAGRFWKRLLSKSRRSYWKHAKGEDHWYIPHGRMGIEGECNYKTW